jgi:hypothetical protein
VTIGKNHRPSPVKGYPHFGGEGNGDPEPTDAALGQHGAGPGRNHELGRGVRVGLLDTRMFPDAWLTGRYIARPEYLLDPGQDSFTVFDGHCAFVGSCCPAGWPPPPNVSAFASCGQPVNTTASDRRWKTRCHQTSPQ